MTGQFSDALDRVTSRMLGSLDPKVTEYDERGLVIRQEDPDHVVTTFTHDAFGNVRSETAMVGTDANGNPLAKTRTDSYDNRGFLTERTDFDGNPTLYTYDDMGHLTTVKLPHDPPNVTTYDLNEAGEVERVTRPGATPQSPAITRAYDYDKMGRVVADKSGDDTPWSFLFNQAGEQIQAVDPRGFKLRTTYDGAGREATRAAYEDGASSPLSSVTFNYDIAGNMTAATNETGTVAATYDNAGRIASVDASGHTTTSTYIGTHLSSRSDAAGTTDYHYDPTTGRVSRIADSLTGTSVWFQYFDSGKIKSHQDGNGLTSTYRYDAAGRPDLQEVRNTTGEVVARFESGYDPNSHVTSRSRVVDDGDFEGPDNGIWSYGYDDAGRLISATDPDGVAFDYGYDPAGNRIEVEETRTMDNPTGGAPVKEIRSTTTRYDSASRPLSSTLTVTSGDISVGSPIETTYGHDAAGNLTRIEGPAGFRSFGYDEWGRMETATKGLPGQAPPVRYAFRYDALDRTVVKETRAGVDGGDAALIREQYWYAGLDQELVRSATEGPELAPAEIETVKYSYRLGAPYAVEKAVGVDDPTLGLERNVTTSFLGSGPHGDVTYSTEPDGDLSGARSYDPWGVPRTDSGDNSDLGYQSDHTDPDTGLVDMGARFYLPELGRFTTMDPLSGSLMNPLSQNPYIYGADDPVSETDPTGMCARSDCPSNQNRRGRQSGSSASNSSSWYSGWRIQETQTHVPIGYGSVVLDPKVLTGMRVSLYGPVLNYVDDAAAVALEFGIDPRFLSAIMLNEGTNRSRGGSGGERIVEAAERLQLFAQDEPGIGLMGMQFGTFKEVTYRNTSEFRVPDDTSDSGWRNHFYSQMTNEQTSLRYAAAEIRHLSNALPSRSSFVDSTGRTLSRADLIAFGYNAGPRAMLDVASGSDAPLSMSYIEDFRTHFGFANALFHYGDGP